MKHTLLFAGALAGLLSASPGWSKPSAPSLLCAEYPDAPVCQGGAPSCGFCHTTPPARNVFGAQLAAELLPDTPRPLSDVDFAAGLGPALAAVEAGDPDGDGSTNIEEILAGTYPADAASRPTIDGCEDDECNFDPAYVLKRIHMDFCGQPATFEAVEAFLEQDAPEASLHETLDACLDSEHWLGKDGVLYQLAHAKIRPSHSIKSGEDPGDVPLGDYDDDYALFVYTQIDDHDARELLTATYFVEASLPPTRYTAYTRTPAEDAGERGLQVAQLVDVERRAGMLTTRWNLALNTMFTPIPRTNAAQAYRAWLGLDIAKMEGLQDVPGEPVDYDQKGVQAAECARCHATLDPLTYPFTRYSGFNGGRPFSYAPNRMRTLSEGRQDNLRDTPEAGAIFGRPVADLLEWGQVAANSEQFAQHIVLDYWRHLIGEAPRPTELEAFAALWTRFSSEHAYGVERMLHDLIETEAYRVP